ncbi:MAG: RNA-directed DNA polymerase [Chryseolinea sp.]
MKPLDVSLDDLVIAYRKAKVDAFYESGHNTAISYADYEINLLENLTKLQSDINSGDNKWVQTPNFSGTYALLLKSVQKENKSKTVINNTVIHSNSKKQWSKNESASVDFRIIGQLSVNFHILSSLWIEKVGYRIETRVSENSYGCRLKRPGQAWNSFVPKKNSESKPNELQLGHFRSYIIDYKRWQTNGIRAIQNSLRKEPRLVVATFDIRKFYHRIDPKFLLDDIFIKEFLKTSFSDEEKQLTELLLSAIEYWDKQILRDPIIPTQFKVNDQCGVPLGLGASKVIANLILIGIDGEIEKKLKPIFYGRYVDDFFIVLKDKSGSVETSDDLWNYISGKLKYLRSNTAQEANSDYTYKLPFSKNSTLEFGRAKEKIFILEGDSGEVLIEKILKDLNENSSEWKMLPDAEENLNELTGSIVNSSSDESDEAPTLRNADKVSIQRLKFSLRLRDFETMVGLAPENIWGEGIDKFFTLSLNFILSAENIPIYYKYYPRIIRLAIQAERPKDFIDLWKRYQESWLFLRDKVNNREDKQLLLKCKDYAIKLVKEAILSSLPIDDKKKILKWTKVLTGLGITMENIDITVERLFFADLHSIPFKRIFLDENGKLPKAWGQNEYSLNAWRERIKSSILKLGIRKTYIKKVAGMKLAASNVPDQKFVPNALFFFTRPHNMLEVSFLIPDWCTGFPLGQFNSFLSMFGLPGVPARLNTSNAEISEKQLREIEIPTLTEVSSQPSFALTSFETKKGSWDALVTDLPELDNTRYARLFGLINEILRRKEIVNYVVFPELSIPRSILLYFALKLRAKNISLIAGVEYEKRLSKPKGLSQVSNQLFIILNTVASGRREQLVIVQEKVEAAIHEKSELRKIGKKTLVPKNKFKFLINHGGFYFSGLICNDFLNINYRDSLRGQIDALVVVEWNQDTETYDSLVQSCSNDLHCFVMQVNNRSYGDTRLRAPYKEAYKRDQVRIRGGEFDYYVLATLDVDELREFQKKRQSPKGLFKPTPTGYKMSIKRRR